MGASVYFAIPVLDENEYLFATLDCIAEQSCKNNIYTYICVNQPDAWWYTDKIDICLRNQELLARLQKNYRNLHIQLIDKSSKGKGWIAKKDGVGIARKTLISNILHHASPDDIIISMDADTYFDTSFVSHVVNDLQSNPQAVALNLPYLHPLSGNEQQDRAILRYELYLRNYMLNMLRINSPYAYTAFGSAIACNVKDYIAIGGFDTQKAGEDFYFLQKMAKYGTIKLYSQANVFPSPRISERVVFGTGTAVVDFQANSYKRYPIFHYSSFDYIQEVYERLDDIYKQDIQTVFTDFLNQHLGETDLWGKLRNNYKTLPMFKKAFHQKVNGLRLFQFLRTLQTTLQKTDEICLHDYITRFCDDCNCSFENILFNNADIDTLSKIRDFLANQEDFMRKQRDLAVFGKI